MKLKEIIKLTSKHRCTVFEDSCPEIEINENIEIPVGGYGLFFIRKTHAKKGLNSANLVFHSGWKGIPTVVIQNFGVSDVELRQGDEIGELWIFGE